MVLISNTKSKTNENRVDSKKKQTNKTNIWSIIQSIVLKSLKVSMSLINYHWILCTNG